MTVVGGWCIKTSLKEKETRLRDPSLREPKEGLRLTEFHETARHSKGAPGPLPPASNLGESRPGCAE